MLKKRKKKDIINSWIIKNQKGLSAVVTTLIVILLVLVAVGIMWVVIRGIVQEGAEGIELGKFTLDLEIKRVQIENGDVTVVVVKRNPGQGNLIGMNFVFSDGTNSETIRENTTLQELEEKSFTFTLTEITTDNLKTISVAPIFELSSGKESAGDIADSFEVTEEMKAGITGDVVGGFAALGFEGMGIVNYSISSGEEIWPEFKRAVVDPLDVLPGHNQTFTVHVYSPHSIVNVTSVTELDNSTLNLDLEKIDEYVENEENITVYSANWIVYDTHAITYRTTFIATDSEGNENNITLTWTDSCQSEIYALGGHGANRVLNTNCATTALTTQGLDGGNLTIASGRVMTISDNSEWIFNDGKSIIVTGSIAMGGGWIVKSNLYMKDEDGDGYGDPYDLDKTLYGGYIRAKDSLGEDCYDADPATTNAELAYPNSTEGWFFADRGDGIFDYNCDDVEEKYRNLVNGECSYCEGVEGDCTGFSGSSGWYTASPAACGTMAWYVSATGTCATRTCTERNCVEEEYSQTCR